ncbi:unnamed protein product [Microthlaspi erraticum]|uniref:Ubiquitin-like protease family profile domain-containing protein n=1 Tax=Microthlaspi erraticum TaxID=1685480 RepID=A0A6D2JWL9_9BRAS|nr:unnamed protein product [Microthlaspi erraticum]
MEEMGLPERMFESGNEPTGRKRVNNHFNLRWVDNIKPALDEEHLEMLAESQYGRLMRMGNHTFAVMFVHYLLSRWFTLQLIVKWVIRTLYREQMHVSRDNKAGPSDRLRLPPHPVSKRTRSEPGTRNVTTRAASKCNPLAYVSPSNSTTELAIQQAAAPPMLWKEKVCTLVGGFSPFILPDEEKVAAVQAISKPNRQLILAPGVAIDGFTLGNFFNASGPPAAEVVEAIIVNMQHRRDRDGDGGYDFLGPSYMTAIKQKYGGFISCVDKKSFEFCSAVRLPLHNRSNNMADVRQLYCPYMIDGKHWVGIIIDLSTTSITVLDCNTACVTVSGVEKYLQPLSEMIPYILRASVGHETANSLPLILFPIHRLDIALLCESPGLSAVATLILIELHATNQILASGDIDDDTLRTATRNYAIALYEDCQ